MLLLQVVSIIEKLGQNMGILDEKWDYSSSSSSSGSQWCHPRLYTTLYTSSHCRRHLL